MKMTATDPLPAIRRIDTDRGDLCGLEVVGHFTSNDLENAYGLLEAAYAQHEKVDLLVRIRHYEGFDWGAVFDEIDGPRKGPGIAPHPQLRGRRRSHLDARRPCGFRSADLDQDQAL